MYRENKCEFPWATLILAIETRNTDSETKPRVCVLYVCVFTTACFFFMFLFINQLYNLGLNLSFVFNLLQGTAQKGAVPWADWEMSHSYSIILGLPAAWARGNTGQEISSINYFLHSGSRSKAQGSPGRDPLWFLTREVGLLVLQYAIQTINVNDVPLFLHRDVLADSKASILIKRITFSLFSFNSSSAGQNWATIYISHLNSWSTLKKS